MVTPFSELQMFFCASLKKTFRLTNYPVNQGPEKWKGLPQEYDRPCTAYKTAVLPQPIP
jgi:hypothetical protein